SLADDGRAPVGRHHIHLSRSVRSSSRPKPAGRTRGGSSMRRRHRVAAMALVGVGSLLVVAPNASAVVKTVDCSKTDLATVPAPTPTNSTIKLKGTCTGNFRVDENLTLVGAPTATLNGGGTGSTLSLSGFHAYHLSHLVVTGGSAGDGGGILFRGG